MVRTEFSFFDYLYKIDKRQLRVRPTEWLKLNLASCVIPGTSDAFVGRAYSVLPCMYVFFWPFDIFLFRPRVFSRALGSVARREPARTPRASLGPGRGPWHVFWGLQVARPLGEAFRTRRAIQAPANPRTG